MKILSVIGTRPEFIHHAPLSRALREAGHHEVLVNTGQHYDFNMAGIFTETMQPDYNLSCGEGSKASQISNMLGAIRLVVVKESHVDLIIVRGDTNSTLAGALVAKTRNLPLAHVEAGMRSGDKSMPEEINRLMVDAVADWYFCPSPTGVANLEREGKIDNVFNVGSLVIDSIIATKQAPAQSTFDAMGLKSGGYLLATIHRAGTVDDADRLAQVIFAMSGIAECVVFPVHPRTAKGLKGLDIPASVKMIEPVGYADMLSLISNARMVLTDSGGVQQEAYHFGVPCVTLRNTTEWRETVKLGWNVLVGTNAERITEAVRTFKPTGERPPVYGTGDTAQRIVDALRVGTMT